MVLRPRSEGHLSLPLPLGPFGCLRIIPFTIAPPSSSKLARGVVLASSWQFKLTQLERARENWMGCPS